MKHFYFILIFISICLQELCAQIHFPATDYVPQSPAASMYSRYTEIPVDLSTGVPGIEIPIHTIELNGLSVPINISYHASGIRVRDLASEVGLGWVINYGAALTANILGGADVNNIVHPFKYRQSSDIYQLMWDAKTLDDQYKLSRMFWEDLSQKSPVYVSGGSLNPIDYFSDRFSYNLCTGESGVFRKDFVNKDIRTIPYSNVKVSEFSRYNITILSSNGTRHCFKVWDATYNDIYFLDRIVNSNQTDSIKYHHSSANYQMDNQTFSINWQFQQPEYTDGNDVLIKDAPSSQFVSHYIGNRGNHLSAKIDSIVTKKELIKFAYISDRIDGTGYRLSAIEIYNTLSSRKLIKKITFGHSYFGDSSSNNQRLRLDKVNIYGSSGNAVDKYEFKYNDLALPPYPRMQEDGPYYEDYWGYYNGRKGKTLLPDFLYRDYNIPDFSSGYTKNMDPNKNYSQACILTEITYPTKGRSVFEYEPNQYSNGKLTGGIRIAKITFYENSSPVSTKTYKYGNEHVKGVYKYNFSHNEPFINVIIYGRSTHPTQLSMNSYDTYSAHSNSFIPINYNNGAAIIYGKVEEYIGDENNNIGRNIYYYEPPKSESYICDDRMSPGYIHRFQHDYGNYKPLLTRFISQKYENGEYIDVKSIKNEYGIYKKDEFNTGLVLASNIRIHNNSTNPDTFMAYYYHYDPHSSFPYLSSLMHCDTKGYTELSLIKSKTETENGVSKKTTYEYDEYAQLIKETLTTSNSSKQINIYKYPYDFVTEDDVYTKMVNRNIIASIIEQTNEKDDVFLESHKINYKDWGNSVVAPESVERKQSGNSSEKRIEYLKYDSYGNPIHIVKNGVDEVIYLWSYKGQYVVAEIKNTTYDKVERSVKSIFGVSGINALSGLESVNKSKLDLLYINSNLENALITTFTHQPLIGILTATDPRGVTTHYNYDYFGRLESIKNNNGQYLEKHQYHQR